MPKSRAEARLAYAVASGDAKNSGMSQSYAKEVVDSLHKRGNGSLKSLPERAKAGAKLLILLLLPSLLLQPPAQAQSPNQGQIARVNPFPSGDGKTSLLFYDGSNNLIYICVADGIQTGRHAAAWAITPSGPQLTLTNIAVATNVATATVSGSNHGLQIGNRVVVAGSTTAALNGTYTVTAGGTTTFTFSTSGVMDNTYSTANLTISTTAPRSDDDTWSIQKLTYNGSNLLTLIQWAFGVQGSYTASCDARTTQFYQ